MGIGKTIESAEKEEEETLEEALGVGWGCEVAPHGWDSNVASRGIGGKLEVTVPAAPAPRGRGAAGGWSCDGTEKQGSVQGSAAGR